MAVYFFPGPKPEKTATETKEEVSFVGAQKKTSSESAAASSMCLPIGRKITHQREKMFHAVGCGKMSNATDVLVVRRASSKAARSVVSMSPQARAMSRTSETASGWY